jgi:hypothetical protein
MNKVACELLKIAKSLISVDFATKDQMDKYLKDHPGANKSNHKVVENKGKHVQKVSPQKSFKTDDLDKSKKIQKLLRESDSNGWGEEEHFKKVMKGIEDEFGKLPNDVQKEVEDYVNVAWGNGDHETYLNQDSGKNNKTVKPEKSKEKIPQELSKKLKSKIETEVNGNKSKIKTYDDLVEIMFNSVDDKAWKDAGDEDDLTDWIYERADEMSEKMGGLPGKRP